MKKFATEIYQERGGKVSFALAILAILFILFYAFSYYSQSRTSNDAGEKEIVSTPTPEERPKTEDLFPTIERETNFSIVKISYPKIPGNSANIEEENRWIYRRFQDASLMFEIDSPPAEEENNDLPKDLPKSSFTADTKKVFENENIISFLTEETFYNRGAAHPSHKVITYVFDKNQEKVLYYLSDVFIVGDSFYKRLNSLVTQKLTTSLEENLETKIDKSGADWIRDGLSTKENPFGKFTLTDIGVTFYFDEYTVAPYAAGPQQVFVSFNELKEFKK